MDATAVAGVAAGVVLAAAVIKALPTLWRFAIAFGQAPTVIQAVAQEFSPNGGGSLRDAIDRTERHVSEVGAWMQRHEDRDDERFRAMTNALAVITQQNAVSKARTDEIDNPQP